MPRLGGEGEEEEGMESPAWSRVKGLHSGAGLVQEQQRAYTLVLAKLCDLGKARSPLCALLPH